MLIYLRSSLGLGGQNADMIFWSPPHRRRKKNRWQFLEGMSIVEFTSCLATTYLHIFFPCWWKFPSFLAASISWECSKGRRKDQERSAFSNSKPIKTKKMRRGCRWLVAVAVQIVVVLQTAKVVKMQLGKVRKIVRKGKVRI